MRRRQSDNIEGVATAAPSLYFQEKEAQMPRGDSGAKRAIKKHDKDHQPQRGGTR